MSMEERAKATAKNIEGKAQEMASEVTGDPKDKIEGQMKQADAQARHSKEDIKDRIKDELR